MNQDHEDEITTSKEDGDQPKIKKGPRCFTKVGITYRRWYIAKEKLWTVKYLDGGRVSGGKYK